MKWHSAVTECCVIKGQIPINKTFQITFIVNQDQTFENATAQNVFDHILDGYQMWSSDNSRLENV